MRGGRSEEGGGLLSSTQSDDALLNLRLSGHWGRQRSPGARPGVGGGKTKTHAVAQMYTEALFARLTNDIRPPRVRVASVCPPDTDQVTLARHCTVTETI